MIDTKTSAEPKQSKRSSLSKFWRTNRKLLFPLIALLLILFGNWLISPNFFNIRVVEGRLLGSLIDILNRGAPGVLLAIGMTLVIATKGIDLSVGAIIAICGAVAAVLIQNSALSPIVVIAISLGVGIICGLWNGVLVAVFDIQPFIATLILMVAGRGIAQLITEGQIAIFNNATLEFLGKGVVLGIPFPIIIAAAVFILAYLFVRRTALGLMIESVGSNDRASFYAGINARAIKLLVYVISGLCAAIAGLIVTADIKGADANNAGLWLELDAVLAVVLGGTMLTGGRFYLGASVVGALIIQSIQTGIFVAGLPVTFNLIVQAVVILTILLIHSEEFRRPFTRLFMRLRKQP